MDPRALRLELERLQHEGQQPFPSKTAALTWGNRVAPLLKFEPVKLPTAGGTYVAMSRLEELRSLPAQPCDLVKLVELLREINVCHAHRCYFSLAALVRTVLNHIPPIFKFTTFAEVANNYGGGGTSFK